MLYLKGIAINTKNNTNILTRTTKEKRQIQANEE